jgi:magnesium transporter
MDSPVKEHVKTRPSSEVGVVASSVYAGGRHVADIAVDDAGAWSKKPGHVVWIGLLDPDYDLLQRVQAQLGLRYLAIEDAGKAHQHPKIEQYVMPYLLWRVPRRSSRKR